MFFTSGKVSPEVFFKEKIRSIEKLLGFKIVNTEYYIKALTHRSYLEISNQIDKSNERLEFLGDSVLGLIVAEYLFRNFRNKEEGFLTKSRSHIVNRDALALVAKKIKLQKFLLYNDRFIKDSDEGMKTIMADALEALIGAIYIDLGIEKAKMFITKNIIEPSLIAGYYRIDNNYKGQLLEFTHARELGTPIYKVIEEEGPDHNKVFTVQVLIEERVLGIGKGKSKKTAEQEAAKIAFQELNTF
ncbi:MAG: ribonuclease III [Ignavibacteria bacterium RBG_13_36_8]|nr:MAG: ribonuclease III [Ignavibacteria bacterium RBG_13_36_8]